MAAASSGDETGVCSTEEFCRSIYSLALVLAGEKCDRGLGERLLVWEGFVATMWAFVSKKGGGLAVAKAADSCRPEVGGKMSGNSSKGLVELKLFSNASRELVKS